MDYTTADLVEAKRQIDSTLHKLRQTGCAECVFCSIIKIPRLRRGIFIDEFCGSILWNFSVICIFVMKDGFKMSVL